MDPKGLKLFEKGMKLYFQQKWDQAIETFLEANELLRENINVYDGPCDTFIKRSEHLKANPPGEDWDGTRTMTSK